jgi:DNA polymerase-3 subunit alpha
MAKERESNQMSLFGGALSSYNTLSVTYPDIMEYDDKAKLSKEREVLGVYVTGHPLTKYMHSFRRFSFKTELLQYYEEDEEGNRVYTEIQDGQRVEMGGIITAMAKKTTKGGSSMCTITLEDVYGGIECVFFPKAYEKYRSLIRAEAIVSVSGRMQVRQGQKPSISVEKFEEIQLEEKKAVSAPKAQAQSNEKREQLGITLPDDDQEAKAEVLETLGYYPGDMPVIIKMNGKYFKASPVRKCNGLIAELKNIVGEANMIFFEK